MIPRSPRGPHALALTEDDGVSSESEVETPGPRLYTDEEAARRQGPEEAKGRRVTRFLVRHSDKRHALKEAKSLGVWRSGATVHVTGKGHVRLVRGDEANSSPKRKDEVFFDELVDGCSLEVDVVEQPYGTKAVVVTSLRGPLKLAAGDQLLAVGETKFVASRLLDDLRRLQTEVLCDGGPRPVGVTYKRPKGPPASPRISLSKLRASVDEFLQGHGDDDDDQDDRENDRENDREKKDDGDCSDDDDDDDLKVLYGNNVEEAEENVVFLTKQDEDDVTSEPNHHYDPAADRLAATEAATEALKLEYQRRERELLRDVEDLQELLSTTTSSSSKRSRGRRPRRKRRKSTMPVLFPPGDDDPSMMSMPVLFPSPPPSPPPPSPLPPSPPPPGKKSAPTSPRRVIVSDDDVSSPFWPRSLSADDAERRERRRPPADVVFVKRDDTLEALLPETPSSGQITHIDVDFSESSYYDSDDDAIEMQLDRVDEPEFLLSAAELAKRDQHLLKESGYVADAEGKKKDDDDPVDPRLVARLVEERESHLRRTFEARLKENDAKHAKNNEALVNKHKRELALRDDAHAATRAKLIKATRPSGETTPGARRDDDQNQHQTTPNDDDDDLPRVVNNPPKRRSPPRVKIVKDHNNRRSSSWISCIFRFGKDQHSSKKPSRIASFGRPHSHSGMWANTTQPPPNQEDVLYC